MFMINALFIWFLIAFLFLILEVGHPGLFFFLSFSIASFASAIVAFFGFSLVIQCAVFLIHFCIAFFVFNFFVKKTQRIQAKTNVYALDGKKAIVLKTINSQQTGQVKIDGEIWSARSLHDVSLAEGIVVIVVQVRGAHLVVKAID